MYTIYFLDVLIKTFHKKLRTLESTNIEIKKIFNRSSTVLE